MANYVTGTSDKNKDTALLLCILGGFFGLHQFYVGNIGKGLLYLCTFGLIGIGWIKDIFSLLFGSFTDNVGMPLRAKKDTNKSNSTNKHTTIINNGPSIDFTDQLRKLNDLKDDGVLTQEEFDLKKKELLNTTQSTNENNIDIEKLFLKHPIRNILITFFILIIIISTSKSILNLQRTQPINNINNSNIVNSESYIDTNDFKESVRSVLQYHEDISNNIVNEAEATGSWLAYNLNIKLYSGLEKKIYYYAMYGEEKYIEEYGNNDLNEVKEFINNL